MSHRMRLMPGAALAVAALSVSIRAAGQEAPAADAQRAIAVELGTGVEYDSNVAILELDTSSGEGDVAGLLDFGIGYDKSPTERVGVKAGYNFSQQLHRDFDDFDVRIHRGSASVRYDLGSVDTGVMLQHVNAALDGDEFLVLKQVSPYVSKLFGTRLFLRMAYAHTDKSFTANPGRDALADSLSSDAFVFLDGLNTYLVFGYRHDDEDAVDAQFDYAGHRLRAQLSRRIARGSRQLTWKTQLRLETRDYEEATPSIGARRKEERYQFEALLEVPLTGRIGLHFGYKYADNRSNLASLDFDENVLSMGFRAKL